MKVHLSVNSQTVSLSHAGAPGASAYGVAVANGFVDDEVAWLALLIGPSGAPGTDRANAVVAPAVLAFGGVGDGVSRTVSQWLSGGDRDRGYADLAAIQVDYPHVVELTDEIDWAALQAALNAAYADYAISRRVVRLPRGVWMVNRTLVVGHETPLIGDSRSASKIKAVTGFPADTPVVRLSLRTSAGTGGPTYEHANLLQKVGIDCNNGEADIGVETYNINENGGLDDFEIKNFAKYGFRALNSSSGPVINYRIRDGHVVSEYCGIDAPIGIDLANGNHPLAVENVTVICKKAEGATPTGSIGVNVAYSAWGAVSVRECHFEYCNVGVNVEANCAALVQNCDAQTGAAAVVRFKAGSSGSAEMIANNLGGGDYSGVCIRDETRGSGINVGANVYRGKWYVGENSVNVRSGVTQSATNDFGLVIVRHGFPSNPTTFVAVVNSPDNAYFAQVHNYGADVDGQYARVRVWDAAGALVQLGGPFPINWVAAL